MYDINFYQQLLARVCSTKWKQFVLTRIYLQNKRVILATEQSIKSFSFIFLCFCLYFKSKRFSRTPYLTMAASANMFYIAIDYENELNMKVAASNVNISCFLNSEFLVSARSLHSGKPQGT